MKRALSIISIVLITHTSIFGQAYRAGFKSVQLKDSTRTYKPDTELNDKLHFRPVDLDIWYPSSSKEGKALRFGDFFDLFEQRAVNYQDNTDYVGLASELAQFYVAEMGIGMDGQVLLDIKTNSFENLMPPLKEHPVILYMAGFNGMGFENYKVLERLASNGYVVISIWSVGRYPGDMTNQKEDMLQQVYDAEFAIRYLSRNNSIKADFDRIGILGCSWGGMSSAVLLERNKNIKAFVSLDGTETHYFGEEDENDKFIQEIHDSALFNPKKQNVEYLYLESGDKLEGFQPSKEYNYFRELNSEKYYLRFEQSSHADFTCIPAILKASDNSVFVYDKIEISTLAFFDKSLKNKGNFYEVWEKIKISDWASQDTYDISRKVDKVFEIEGLILDKNSGKPVPYVNIGVLDKEIGSVSDTDGKFALSLNEEFVNETIRISSIGYKPIEFLVKDVLNEDPSITIQLEEEISELKEVVITAKAFKKKILGNKTKSKFLGTGFNYDQLGAEMGIKINVRRNPTYVDAFNFLISYNRLSARSVFRLNLYTVENNKPKENILTENILVAIEPKQVGQVTIDLKPYDIILRNDVIATLEWVDNEGKNNKGEGIFFPLGLFGSGTIYKKSSQSKFKKYSSMGVGFSIDVRY